MRATIVVAMVLLAAACGEPEEVGRRVDDGSPTTSSPDVTTTSPVPSGGAAPSLESLGLSIPQDCPVPWGPVYAQSEVHYPDTLPTSEARPERGESLDVLARRFDPPDTDGDGTADVVGDTATTGETVVISRTDGDLVLAADGGTIGTPGGVTWIGDLDGDGRDELAVFSSAEEPADGGYPIYVVAGSTPNGRHDPAAVGVRLPVSSGAWLLPAGDQNGDGNDDLLMAAGDAGRVVDGPQVMAPGPGGVLDGVPAAVPGTPDGWINGVVRLAPDRPPVLVRLTGQEGDGVTLELWTDPGVILATRRVPLTLDRARGMPPLTAYRSGGDRIIELASQMDRSGATTAWAWNLDRPCAGATPAG
jgi:hypothetical protein